MTDIIIKKQKPKPSIVYDTYWRFAAERQNIFFNKIEGTLKLTSDDILLKHKFTNAYRASDRVSQYLINNVIYTENNYNEEDILFRILLFKIFNKIETWELLSSAIGDICIKTFSYDIYSQILNEAKNANERIYSGAYIMTSGKSEYGSSLKHQNHLKLLAQEVINKSLINHVLKTNSLESLYKLLLSIPTFGSFLSYQFAIDINYSTLTSFDEMEFVVPGPGAKDGIKKCFTHFGDYDFADIIKYVTENQENEFDRLNLNFQNLWGRSLQLIDCQNLFCETDKYSRIKHPEISGYSNRTRIKQIYKRKNIPIVYCYPPKWNINYDSL